MPESHYNDFAGQNLDRLMALSDGVFAVAMTLLVLDLHVPAVSAVRGEADLARALLGLAPRLLVYMMSFITLGIFWVGQQTQLNHLEAGHRDVTWLHLCFLFAVSLTPFSTAFMAAFFTYRLALVIYWLNILALGLLLLATWRCALARGLVSGSMSGTARKAVVKRIIVSQLLYAAGAALCVINPAISLGCIILIQLNYAIAPHFGRSAG